MRKKMDKKLPMKDICNHMQTYTNVWNHFKMMKLLLEIRTRQNQFLPIAFVLLDFLNEHVTHCKKKSIKKFYHKTVTYIFIGQNKVQC